jgi:hypothetical protein
MGQDFALPPHNILPDLCFKSLHRLLQRFGAAPKGERKHLQLPGGSFLASSEVIGQIAR